MVDKKLIRFLNDSQLAGEEFTILYLIYLSKIDSEMNTQFAEYIEINKDKFKYEKLIDSLVNQGYINNYNKKDQFNLDKIEITSKFTDKLFIDIDIAWKQVLDIYPKLIKWFDKPSNTHKTTPSFGDLTKDKILYQQLIQNRRDKHFEFIEIIRQYVAKNNGTAVYKFENLVANYESIKMGMEELIKNDELNDYDIN